VLDDDEDHPVPRSGVEKLIVGKIMTHAACCCPGMSPMHDRFLCPVMSHGPRSRLFEVRR
jgi:hypothetical protein